MASLILDKSLARLRSKLAQKGVQLTVADDLREWLLSRGFTKEYGARELDRVVNSTLKPLLMREILFGRLQRGGNVEAKLKDGEVVVE